MSLSMRGQSGEVRYGYQLAAQLGPWQLSDNRLETSTTYQNDMWLTVGALTLRLNVGEKLWVWRDIEVLSIEPFILRLPGSPEVK
jgi:hypothetical protein